MKLTGEIVCAIIKTCAESGVVHFSLGDLKIQFKGTPPPDPVQEFVVEPQLHEAVTAAAIERDELAQKEAQLAQMEIEDPLGYEKAVESGDLIDSKAGDELDEENSRPESDL